MSTLKPLRCNKTILGMACLLSILALIPCALAQKYVFDNASFATGLRPVWVATGDFNRDGIADVVVVNECGTAPDCLSDGSVSILLGRPDGTFQSPADYPTQTEPTFALVGDFNEDSNPDIAVTNVVSNTISILIGNGDGTFRSVVNFDTGVAPVSADAGDVNRDGHLDLVVANAGGKSVSILFGRGDGTFRTHVDYATSFAPQSVDAADFNGDGKLDLALAESNVAVLLGNGDGTFGTATEYPGDNARFVVAGDWNADGKLDLASVGQFDDKLSILQGNGDGTFQTPAQIDELGGIGASIVSVDLNGDGHPDLAVGTQPGGFGPNASGTISVLLNKGDGTFQPHRDFGGMAAGALAAGDFNGDGVPDMAVPNPDFNTVNIVLSDGRGALGSIFDLLSPPVYPTEVMPGDFDGDGKLDLSMGLQGSGAVAVALGKGDGTFGPPLVDNAPGAAPRIAVGDFNGDGILDLAAFVYSVLDNVQILIGKGDGTFQPRSTFPVANSPGEILAADFNGDGKLDLAVIGFGVDILLGNGDGTFQPPIAFPSLISYAALVADFNADQKPDLATVSGTSQDLTIFLGNGDGTFQPGVDYATGVSPVALATSDFNGDGKPDLTTANAGSDSTSVFLGNGDGTFAPKADFVTVQGPRSVAAGDFDGDGNSDLIVTGNGVSVLFGHGNGSFASHEDYLASLAMGPAVSSDFDGDRRPDVAVVNQSAVSISMFLNRTAVALRPYQLSFPVQLAGTVSSPREFTLYNPGILPVDIQSITTAGDFAQTNTCGSVVATASNCSASVTFAPTAGGQRSGTAIISDNAMRGTQVVLLSGAATDFALGAATGANCPPGGNCSTSAAISSGQTATYDLQVTPISGFNGTVSLSCAGTPNGSSCSISPATVSANGSYAFVVTVANVTLAAGRTKKDVPGVPASPAPAGVPLLLGTTTLGLLGICVALSAGNTKRLSTIALLPLLLALGCISGCGDGGQSVTPPTKFTITITGNSGGVNRTLALSLSVSH